MSIDEINARREARKAALAARAAEQETRDIEALDDFEAERGDTSVAAVRVAYTPGLTTMAIVRCPTRAEIKRFQARTKGKDPDVVAAATELAEACLLYPQGEAYAQLVEARPGLPVQLGTAAIRLATGQAEAEGKD